MANIVLQGARAAVPYLVNTASQAALAYANQGISNFLNTSVTQGPRLGNLLLQTKAGPVRFGIYMRRFPIRDGYTRS